MFDVNSQVRKNDTYFLYILKISKKKKIKEPVGDCSSNKALKINVSDWLVNGYSPISSTNQMAGKFYTLKSFRTWDRYLKCIAVSETPMTAYNEELRKRGRREGQERKNSKRG